MARKVVAIIIWTVAAVLVTFLNFSNDKAVIAVDLSGLKAKEIAVATAREYTEYLDVPVMDFLSRSYEIVLVHPGGQNEIYYEGRADNRWYRSHEIAASGLTQEIKRVELGGSYLTIYCDKSGAVVAVAIFIMLVVGGGLGIVVYFSDDKTSAKKDAS
ncbi:MAG: hypothetical protein WC514_01550 [Candidatus Paceibacterota bacterium]